MKPEETIILLGAGASADVGLPTTAELHERLSEVLPPLYRRLGSLVFEDNDPDVEELFRVIEFIHAVETRNRPGERRSEHESVGLANLVQEWKEPLQEYLAEQNFVVTGSPTGRLIDQLREALGDLLTLRFNNQQDLAYLRDLVMGSRGGTICTLNYDNTFEHVISYGTWRLDSGPYPIDRSVTYPGQPAVENTIRLIKLHGSLSWGMNSDGSVWDGGPIQLPLTYVPGIIFGAGNKLRPTGPFLDLYIEFRDALRVARRLIVIGYGFRDAHVNELLRRWIQENSTPNRLLRISRLLGGEMPSLVESWDPEAHQVQVEVIEGRASQQMERLIRKPSALTDPDE